MKLFSIIFGCTILLFLSCNNSDWILFRAGQDYFPLKTGNYWKYDKKGTIEIIEVKSDTVVNNVMASHLLRNGADEYWVKNGNEIKKFYSQTINYGGTDYIIQQAYLLEYKLPFVLGAFWTDVFTDTVEVLGTSIRLKQTIARWITEITEQTVPAGSFQQVYKIEFSKTLELNDSIYEQCSGYEWFAPEVGLIKRISADTTSSLIEYQIK